MKRTLPLLMIAAALLFVRCLPGENRSAEILDVLLAGAAAAEHNSTRQVLAQSIIALSGSVTDENGAALGQAELRLVHSGGGILAEGIYTDTKGDWNLELSPTEKNFTVFLHVYRSGTRVGIYAVDISIAVDSLELTIVTRKTEGNINISASANLEPRIILGHVPSVINEGNNRALTLVYGRRIKENRTVRVSSSLASVTIDGNSSREITFTPLDWNVAREVVIEFAHDENLVTDEVDITVSEPGHADYTFRITITDSDTQAIILSNFNTALNEGDSIQAQVSLSNMPQTNLDVQITSTDPGAVSLNVATLTFTPANYSTPQNVQITAVQDPGITNETARVGFSVPSIPAVVAHNRDITVQDDDPGPSSTTLTGQNKGRFPRGLLVGGKLVVVSSGGSGPSTGPVLSVCNPDGSGCVERQNWVGFGYHPDMAYDAANDRLLIVSYHVDHLYLFRCTSDGVTCSSYFLINGGGPYLSPRIKIDTVNGKFLVAYDQGSNFSRLGLVRCNLDVTGCALHDVLAGQGNESGNHPRLLLDYVNNKILITTLHRIGSWNQALFRCDLDATNCAYTNLTGAAGTTQLGADYSAVIDTTRNRLVLAGNGNRIIDCALDGGDCGMHTVSNLTRPNFMMHNNAIGKTLMLNADHFITPTNDPLLVQCDALGVNCASYTFSPGAVLGGASMIRDDANQQYLMLMEDATNSSPAVLLRLPYNFAD